MKIIIEYENDIEKQNLKKEVKELIGERCLNYESTPTLLIIVDHIDTGTIKISEGKVYEKAIKLWDYKQVDLLLEENNELILATSNILHSVHKAKRKYDGQLPHKIAVKILNQEKNYIENVIEEFADNIIMWSQFIPDFWNRLLRYKKTKLLRTEEKIDKKLKELE